jgi:choline transport protein
VALRADFLRVMPLIIAPSKIAWTTQATLYLSVTGCLIFLLVVGAMHGPAQPASFITSSSFGSSGWSFGVAWVLGITNAMYAFGATDGGMFARRGHISRSHR